MTGFNQSSLAFLWQYAALRVSVKFARLELAMRKYGHDPNQPRAPAGSPIGGRWIDGDVAPGEPTRVRVAVSAFDNPGLYYIDLEREDLKGGHGFRDHVGKTPSQLIAFMIAENSPQDGTLHPAEGSFRSAGEANNLVSQILRLHPETVQSAINGETQNGGRFFRILHRFGFVTGFEPYQPDNKYPPIIRPTYSVEIYITHDPSPSGHGYRVHTAYPRNNVPNEVVRRTA